MLKGSIVLDRYVTYFFTKEAERLDQVKRRDRERVFRDSLQKHMAADKLGLSKTKVVTRSPIFGLLSPEADIEMYLDGKNVSQANGWTTSPTTGRAGAALSLKKRKWFKPEYDIDADALYLKKEYQGRGIGSKAIKQIRAAGKDMGAKNILIKGDKSGKVVWSRVPGVQFQDAEKRSVNKDYQKWKEKHGGPNVPAGSSPDKYPKDFLRQWGTGLGYIGYKIPLE